MQQSIDDRLEYILSHRIVLYHIPYSFFYQPHGPRLWIEALIFGAFRVRGLEFRVQAVGFWVLHGSGFRVNAR